MFDKLMLIADGRMVYFGDRQHVVGYLNDAGYKCHNNFNPADYIRTFAFTTSAVNIRSLRLTPNRFTCAVLQQSNY